MFGWRRYGQKKKNDMGEGSLDKGTGFPAKNEKAGRILLTGT